MFVDTYMSVVDIADSTEAHILAAERGRAGARYVSTARRSRRARPSTHVGVSGRASSGADRVAGGRGSAAGLLEGAYALRGGVPSLCRARIRTFLHGHQYDGSLAERGRAGYTPVEETFRRTIAWAEEQGLVEAARRERQRRH